MKDSCSKDGSQAEQATIAVAPAFRMQKTEQITMFVTQELSISPSCDGLASTIFIMRLGSAFQISSREQMFHQKTHLK